MNDKYKNLKINIEDCKKCQTLKPWSKFPFNKKGNLSAKAMIISEAPGMVSIKNQKLWTGQGGLRLRKVLREFNYELEQLFYLTDTVKCLPHNNRDPFEDELYNCHDFLKAEIQLIKPTIILSFGRFGFEYIAKHFKAKGEIPQGKITSIHNESGFHRLEFKNFDAIPLLHPSSANRFMHYETYKNHLRKVFQLIIDMNKL